MCVSPSLKKGKGKLARRDLAARLILQNLEDLSIPESILRSFLLDVGWPWKPFLSGSDWRGYPAEDVHTRRGAVTPWQPIALMPAAVEITFGIQGSCSTLILLAILRGGENAIRHTHFIHEEAAFEAAKSSVPGESIRLGHFRYCFC